MSELKIPETWAEANIMDIGKRIGGGTPSRANKDYYRGKTPWITVSDISKDQFHIYNIETSREFITQKAIEDSAATLIPVGSVVLSTRVSVGKVGINSVEICTNQDFSSFTGIKIHPKFLAYFLISSHKFFKNNSHGATIQGINLKVFDTLRIPIPPLKEQERIVKKIEACFSRIDETEKALDEAEELLKKYRASLLAKAFRGELVAQDPSDESAAELLKRIRAEREKNQDGKKKKSHDLPPIKEDEIPFPIPANWCWVRLGELGNWHSGGTPSKANPKFWDNGDIPWVSPKDMKSITIFDSEDHITQYALNDSKIKLLPKNSILFVTRSGILRHTLPVAITDKPVTVNQDIKALVLHPEISPDFVLFMLFAFEKKILEACAKKGATVESIEFDNLLNFLIPLPPIQEQKRIYSYALKAIDKIDNSVNDIFSKQSLMAKLRESILRSAFMGELVKQRPEEGTGHELLANILEEKKITSQKDVPQTKTAKKRTTR